MKKLFNYSADVIQNLDAAIVREIGEAYQRDGQADVASALITASDSILELSRR